MRPSQETLADARLVQVVGPRGRDGDRLARTLLVRIRAAILARWLMPNRWMSNASLVRCQGLPVTEVGPWHLLKSVATAGCASKDPYGHGSCDHHPWYGSLARSELLRTCEGS